MTATPLTWTAWCGRRSCAAHEIVAALGTTGLPSTLIRKRTKSTERGEHSCADEFDPPMHDAERTS